MDLYNKERTLEQQKERFKEECIRCYKLLEKFERTLRINNYSISRIEKYWTSLRTIHKILEKCFEDAKKEDIEELVIKIDSNKNWSEWTKHDLKRILKFFFRWLKFGKLEGEYPEEVKWIKAKIKRNNSKTPEQILTKEEIELMAGKARNKRDKALVLTLYESGCRIGEFLKMRIKDIQFDEYGCYILVSGKTGWRRVRLVEYSKNLLEWLDMHPFKNNPESFVWINLEHPNPNEPIKPETVNNLLKKLAKECNISKPVHPHAFRHARATHLAKHLPDAVLKKFFGWTQDSRMASVYFHLSGKDTDEALLKMYGIKVEEKKEEKKGIKICPRCGEVNNVLSHFCKKCGNPLDIKVAIELEEKRREFEEFLAEFLEYYAEKNPEFKKFFVEFVKKRRAFDFFHL